VSQKRSKKNSKKGKKPEKKNSSTNSKIIWLEIILASGAVLSFFIWISLYHYSEKAIESVMHNTFYTGVIGYDTASFIASLFGYAAFLIPVVISLIFLAFLYKHLVKYLILNTLLFVFIMPFFQLIETDPLMWKITGGLFGDVFLNKLLIPYIGKFGTYLLLIFVFILYGILSLKIPIMTSTWRTISNSIKSFPSFKFWEKDGGKTEDSSKKGNRIDFDPNMHNELQEKVESEGIDLIIPSSDEEPVAVENNRDREDKKVIKEENNGEIKEDDNTLLDSINSAIKSGIDDLDDNFDQEETLPTEEKDIDVVSQVKKGKKSRSTALRKLKNYKLPPLSFLAEKEVSVSSGNREKKIKELALTIERKLLEHKVKVGVAGAVIGPVVTMYEMMLGEGVRVNQVANMEQDLGIVVGGKRVRVVPRIPGKPYIGIEVPNEDKEIIRLRDILDSDQFNKAKSKGLPIALGETVDGEPMVGNLAKMPHLLVAGTTGSGKSVGVNTIIISFLFNMTPDEVKFIMIDPKANEFNIYEGIPHLLLPVVTDPKKAALALKWAVDEMESRYRLLAENMVRDIASYNEKIDNINKSLKNSEEKMSKMPYVVVIIDEFADLMTVAGKDVEIAVMRIAQKARAAGIHLIIATQRPTRDVITGTIKSNLPVRIAFRVASSLDSRTILDCKGAEMLLGNGDMLYIPPGSSEPTRVHGAFVSTEEIKGIVSFIKDQFPEGENPYENVQLSSSPEEFISSTESGEGSDDDDRDPLYDEIINYIRRTRKCSASMLQRQFKVGYNRAARIVDSLEREGLIGPGDGAKPREVLLSEEN